MFDQLFVDPIRFCGTPFLAVFLPNSLCSFHVELVVEVLFLREMCCSFYKNIEFLCWLCIWVCEVKLRAIEIWKISVAWSFNPQQAVPQTSNKPHSVNFLINCFICFCLKLTMSPCSIFFQLIKVLGVIEISVLGIFVGVLVLFLFKVKFKT